VARIAGVDLPKQKRSEIGLTYIYGIGRSSSQKILTKAGVDWNRHVADLTDEEVAKIRSIITSDYRVEGALRSEVQMNIKRLTDIGSYRGIRHRKGLPVRGQRTRTNARTRKGKRKTVAGRKKAVAKK
jgi:small subunit ribosomal protein S13